MKIIPQQKEEKSSQIVIKEVSPPIADDKSQLFYGMIYRDSSWQIQEKETKFTLGGVGIGTIFLVSSLGLLVSAMSLEANSSSMADQNWQDRAHRTLKTSSIFFGLAAVSYLSSWIFHKLEQ